MTRTGAGPAPRCWAVVPAAGRGERVGSGLPKQYLPLAGATVLEHALRPFIDHPRIAGIVVVLAADDRHWRRLACADRTDVMTAAGGDRRVDSVLSGLDALGSRAAAQDWVLVHDAARPCLTRADVDRMLDSLIDTDVGGLLALPIADTLKRSDAGGTVSTGSVERSGLWRAQTPQMFRFGALRKALAAAIARGVELTDEASAMEAAGLSPRLIPGSARNIKITHGDDLVLAEALLHEHPTAGTRRQ